MKIKTSSSAMPAFDGRILLRMVIDRPAEQGSRLLDYLSSFSVKIEAFAREKLFLRLTEMYEKSYGNNLRNSAYNFSFKIICTYESADLSSCLLITHLYQGSNHLVSNADSVISLADDFIPPILITKQKITGAALVLDREGNPTWADVSSGGIVYTPAKTFKSIL